MQTFEPLPNQDLRSNSTLGASSLSLSSSEGGQKKYYTPTNAIPVQIPTVPILPSREMLPQKKPDVPKKPELFRSMPALPLNMCYECQPFYANSAEMSFIDDSDTAGSDGSSTPTNAERSASPVVNIYQQTGQMRSSVASSSSSQASKPAIPLRRSTLSNPNAITRGTLKRVGCSSYEEIKQLVRDPLYANLDEIRKLRDNIDKPRSDASKVPNGLCRTYSDAINKPSSQVVYQSAIQANSRKDVNQSARSAILPFVNDDPQTLPLPSPPPEAYSDSEATISSRRYNKITNIHRQFLETLNSKLTQQTHMNPGLPKQRSMSLTRGEDAGSNGSISNRVQRWVDYLRLF